MHEYVAESYLFSIPLHTQNAGPGLMRPKGTMDASLGGQMNNINNEKTFPNASHRIIQIYNLRTKSELQREEEGIAPPSDLAVWLPILQDWPGANRN